MPQGISPNPLNKISEVYLSQISEHHKKDADGNTIPHEGEEVEEGAGLYANIHAKRKRGGKMRKKGDKGAPSSQDFANAARTAKEETEIGEAKVDQGKDDAAKINTRNQRTFGNRRDSKGGMTHSDDTEARRYNTEKGRGVKMRGKKDKTPVNYRERDRQKAVDELLGRKKKAASNNKPLFRVISPNSPEGRKIAQSRGVKEEVVTELNRFEKEKGVDTKTGKPVTKGGTAKNDRAFQSVMKKFGKQRMGANQPKKVRGAKNPNETSPTKQKMTRMKAAKASSRAFETRAKRSGYKTAQDYANVVARYGSEDNMKKGRGLGT